MNNSMEGTGLMSPNVKWISEFNSQHNCDFISEKEFNEEWERISCLDDEGNYLRYHEIFEDLDVYIIYDLINNYYSASFSKETVFNPRYTSFRTSSWDILLDQIKIELREQKFSEFLGVLKKNSILKAIQDHGNLVFDQHQKDILRSEINKS